MVFCWKTKGKSPAPWLVFCVNSDVPLFRVAWKITRVDFAQAGYTQNLRSANVHASERPIRPKASVGYDQALIAAVGIHNVYAPVPIPCTPENNLGPIGGPSRQGIRAGGVGQPAYIAPVHVHGVNINVAGCSSGENDLSTVGEPPGEGIASVRGDESGS